MKAIQTSFDVSTPERMGTCTICGGPTQGTLWCMECLRPYVQKGLWWQAIEESKKARIRRRKEAFGR